jgi:hypothetical protein
LPPWLTDADPINARCPNCGHINGAAAAPTPAPHPLPKSTNAYAPLDPPAPNGKLPSLMKTQVMGSAPPIPSASATPPPSPALAQTMMLSSKAPARAAKPAPAPAKPAHKRVATLPQGAPELLPQEPAPSPSLARTTLLPDRPAAAVRTTLLPAGPKATEAPAGATPAEAAETDADISIELETPPPAPPSRKSLPAWVVSGDVEDADPDPEVIPNRLAVLQSRTAKLVAAGAGGLVLVVLAVVLLRHGGKPSEGGSVPPARSATIAHEQAVAPVVPKTVAPVVPRTAPDRAGPLTAARPAAKSKEPRLVAAPVEKPAPVHQPAPEREAVVASPNHLAVVSPREHAAPAAPADPQRASEAYARGNAQLFQGHVDEAIASFKDSLKADPRNPAAMRGLGLAYVQAGNAGQAVHFLKRYLKASPTASDRALIEKRLEQLGAQ